MTRQTAEYLKEHLVIKLEKEPEDINVVKIVVKLLLKDFEGNYEKISEDYVYAVDN
jgi:hypothetical protein